MIPTAFRPMSSRLAQAPFQLFKKNGTLSYAPCTASHLHELGVSVNNRPLGHVIFKINQTAILHETLLTGDDIFSETLLQAQWTRGDHRLICNNAIDLIKWLPNSNTPIHPETATIITESMLGDNPWPVTEHTAVRITPP